MLGNPDMSSGILKDIGPDTSSEKKILAAICLAAKGDFAKGLQELNSITTTTNSPIIENNKALFRLAPDKSLKIGDDELGYQLRIKPYHNSKQHENKEISSYTTCLDSSSKSISMKRDSIRIASDDMLYLLKGDKNYENGLLIKKALLGHSVIIYTISTSNQCADFISERILVHSDNNYKLYEAGLFLKSAYVRLE